MSLPYVATLDVKPALHKILFALYQYHVLTTKLVVLAVGKPGAATTVMENIQKLEEKRYLYRFPLATTAGRSPLVCVLAEQGMKYLRDERGLDLAFYKHPSEWKSMSSSWLMHPLELNKFIIAATKVAEVDARIALIQWEHDFLLRSTPFEAIDEAGQKHRVIPDAILHFTVKRSPSEPPKRRIVLVELERDTHKTKAFIDKIRGIYWVVENGLLQERYNHPIPRIAIISPVDTAHVRWMREQTVNTLVAIRGTIPPDNLRNRMFHFRTIPPLQGEDIPLLNTFVEPSWYHPLDEPNRSHYSLLGV